MYLALYGPKVSVIFDHPYNDYVDARTPGQHIAIAAQIGGNLRHDQACAAPYYHAS